MIKCALKTEEKMIRLFACAHFPRILSGSRSAGSAFGRMDVTIHFGAMEQT